MSKNLKFLCLVGLSAWTSFPLYADLFHYHNLVVGERAMGLGGAFCAVSDDASGIVFNPAGLGFAQSSDISGSANAIYAKKTTYKKTIANDDFVEKSSGTLSPFFGGLQKLDSTWPGLAAAFAIYATDSELKDQNDIIEDIGGLDRFHRTTNIRASTTGYGLGAAKRISSNLSLGIAIAYLAIDELVQEYQDVQYKSGVFLTQNYRTRLSAGGLDTALGMQYAVGNFSFGLMTRIRSILHERYEIGLDYRTNLDTASNAPGALSRVVRDDTLNEPLVELPTEIRLGVAWFPSAVFLWSFDVIHNTAAESDVFKREAVTNFATGAEYYITPSIPVRTGVFTNYDTRPELVEGRQNQPDHVDYTGATLFLGWVQPNSQVSAGFILQNGEGKAQKIQGPNIQTVEAQSFTFALSATHSF